jgi:sarcosine oxidase subunit alpha
VSALFRTRDGGRIDRTKPLAFTFDGRPLTGLAGDTLASALLANGIHLVGRSFKYHRPRGIMAAGSDEPNALVHVDRGDGREAPNLRATQVELYAELCAESQNRSPSLKIDVGAMNNWLSPLLPAGFQYKTFMWPVPFWKKVYEPTIRAMAGLGRAPTAPDPDYYLHRYAHCDVLIAGAGPAGLAAALAAAESGVRVILCDEQAEFGGALLSETLASVDGKPAWQWVADTVAALATRDNVRLVARATAYGYYADNFIALAERVTDHLAKPDPRLPRERLWQIRARQVVLATGAIERPLVFCDNDRPGIMLADSARTYANRYGVIPGRRAILLTADDSAYVAAVDLKRAGVEITIIADLRSRADGPAIDAARQAGITVATSHTICGTRGRLRVRSARLGVVAATSRIRGESIGCDLILMSGGWTPSVHLFSQARGKLRFNEQLQAFVPGTPLARVHCAGAVTGTYDLAACLEEGYAAGQAAAGAATGQALTARTFAISGATKLNGGLLGACPNDRRAKAFVDFQSDVTTEDLKLAAREGFRSIEHVKRYTMTGMGTDQGKTSNMNALAITAAELGKPIPMVGHTTFRNPYTPVTFGTIAGTARGTLFEPVRQTPIHNWAEQQGAKFEDVGLWKRAHYFPRPGEDLRTAVARECRTVRSAAGLFDASTLGKIEVVGPDATRFMNLLYVNAWDRLPVGRCRYGVMLTEAGFVLDDGVVGRLASDRFHVTTTTGGTARVLHHMEDYLQTEFTELRVWLTSTTEQWAVVAVQGPRARDVITPLIEDIDLSSQAMPHLSVRLGRICGVECRLFRVSFTGELGYEINIPADYGEAIWAAVFASGKPFGMTPYGTESMHVLRAEKGYLIVGQETDGTQTLADLALEGMVGKSKTDFVGKRSLTRPDFLRSDRKQLVGLLTDDAMTVLEEGAQVVTGANQCLPMTTLGHVTSSYWSETLGRGIALALVSGGRTRLGTEVAVPMPDRIIRARVVEHAFFDKEGARLDA